MNVTALRIAVLLVIFAVWELASGPLISPFFVSKPSAIATALWGFIQSGALARNMVITASEAIAGFIVGGLAGGIVGLVFGRSAFLGRTFDPFLTALYSLPKIALAPLFILWFGVEFQMRMLFTAAIVFFLVFLNTYTGVRNVSRELLTVFRLMGAREWHLARMVVIPSAFAWTFAGLRLSVPYALIGAIVAEIMAGNSGLGYMIVHSAAQFDTAGVFAALIAVMVLSLLLNLVVRLLEKHAMPWLVVGEEREVAV